MRPRWSRESVRWGLRFGSLGLLGLSLVFWWMSYRPAVELRELYVAWGTYSARVEVSRGRLWIVCIAFSTSSDPETRHLLTQVASERGTRWYGQRHLPRAAGTAWYPSIPFWEIAAACALGCAMPWWRVVKRPQTAVCAACGYNLAGLPPGTRCPECAASLAAEKIISRPGRGARARHRRAGSVR
jgi:hypothetical protein